MRLGRASTLAMCCIIATAGSLAPAATLAQQETTTPSDIAGTTDTAVASGATGDAPQPRIEPMPDGSMRMVFGGRSLDSDFANLSLRFNWSKRFGPKPTPYSIENESFVVYMPPDYNPAQATHGLMIWISPSAHGGVPAPWVPVLDQQRLVWIGANDAGNDRPVQWHRLALALDALHNLTQHFAIDEERIYVSGFSGGSRAASLLAQNYPDLLRGVLCICGVNYFRAVGNTERRGYHFEAQFMRPGPELYNLACTRSHFVLLTGERDFNRIETYSIYKNGFRRDPFKHVAYIEVPDLEHEIPDAEWFERALQALDDPSSVEEDG